VIAELEEMIEKALEIKQRDAAWYWAGEALGEGFS